MIVTTGGILLAPSGKSPAVLLHILQCTRQSFPVKTYLAHSVYSTEVEKPCHEGGGNRNEVMMKEHGMKYWWESLLEILNEVLGSIDF